MEYSPPASIGSPLSPTSPTANGSSTSPISPESIDLDTPDELAVRSLLLGIVHRTVGQYDTSRHFLTEAHESKHSVSTSTWVAGVACFELAVVELKEAEATLGSSTNGVEDAGDVMVNGIRGVMDDEKKHKWFIVLDKAHRHLEVALSLATQTVDLSSRLDTRIAMLKDEIELKKEMLEAA